MKKIIIIISVLILVLILCYLVYNSFNKEENNIQESISNNTQRTTEIDDNIVFPIAEFKERITKKPFGIYIDTENSPVQPERFQGFHTGVDVEYEDIETDVPVYVVNDGKIVLSKPVSGYGGVIIIETENTYNVLYGHLRPNSMLEVDKVVKKGDQIGLLGTGFSSETDGERKHLHYAILSDNRIDLKGYVQNQSELSGWIDPLL